MMTNIRTAHIDIGAIEIDGAVHHDEIVTFAGGATYKTGTILARDTVTDKLIPYVKGGNTNGDGVPCAVLTYELYRSTAGDGSNVDEVALDLLRARAIVASEVHQLSEYN